MKIQKVIKKANDKQTIRQKNSKSHIHIPTHTHTWIPCTWFAMQTQNKILKNTTNAKERTTTDNTLMCSGDILRNVTVT